MRVNYEVTVTYILVWNLIFHAIVHLHVCNSLCHVTMTKYFPCGSHMYLVFGFLPKVSNVSFVSMIFASLLAELAEETSTDPEPSYKTMTAVSVN